MDLRSFAQPSHVQAPVAAEMVHNAHDKSWVIVHSERWEFESQLILVTIDFSHQTKHQNQSIPSKGWVVVNHSQDFADRRAPILWAWGIQCPVGGSL